MEFNSKKMMIFLSITVIVIGVFNLYVQSVLIWTGLLLFIVVLFGKMITMYERERVHRDQYKKELAGMADELQEYKKKCTEYEDVLNAIGGAIYSVDVLKNKFLSNVFSDIFDISTIEFEDGPINKWRSLIHPDDLHRVEKFEIKVLAGQSSTIEYQIMHPNEGVKWILHSAASVKDRSGTVTQINGHLMDITRRKQVELQLRQMAFYDELTDLPNRKALDQHIGKALARSKRHAHNFSIMFIDLDGFKNVNDTFGHDTGDRLLKEVAERLKNSVREEDLIARIGGDEFVVVFEETNKREIEEIASRIIEHTAQPYYINENDASITVSLGISMFPDDGDTKETLLEKADKAMYFAKKNGKNNYQLYTPDLHELEGMKTGILEKWMNMMQNSIFSFK